MRRRMAVPASIVALGVKVLSVRCLLVQNVLAKPEKAIVCRTSITAGLTAGPHAPLDLRGDIELYVQPNQSFTGRLTRKQDGGTVNITGQGVGHGIDSVFAPASGKQLFAHGVWFSIVAPAQPSGPGPDFDL